MSIRRAFSTLVLTLAFVLTVSASFATSAVACDPGNPIGICSGDAAE